MNKIRFFKMDKNDLNRDVLNYLIERIYFYVGFGKKHLKLLASPLESVGI